MKRLKFFLTILCTSFTLVVLFNNLFIYIHLSQLTLTPINIFEIFVICLLIAGISVSIELIPYVRDHLFLGCYIVMLTIAVLAEYFKSQTFYWSDVLIEVFFLTLIYLAVWFCLYLDDERNIKLINAKIKKRNQK